MTVPPFIGLTGGVGAGKSTALACLERLGAAVISTDAVVHELYGDPRVIAAVTERFGDDVAPGGIVERGLLAIRAFATEADREWLEQLLWPLVGQRVAAWREQQQRLACAATQTATGAVVRTSAKALVVETPLLFEAGLDKNYDATVAVVAPEAVRSARAAARGHLAIDERTARQLSQDEKARLATYTVVNDGDVAALEAKLSTVLAKLQR
jgi:dephospho-CoA kinase